MNFSDSAWFVVFAAGIAALTLGRIYRGGISRVFVTDYQRGVRFVQGSLHDLLEPGSYESNRSREQITIVDMRPIPVVIERVLYQDALLAPSVISIGAELSVNDPLLATTKLKNQITDSMQIIRDGLRAFVSKGIASPDAEGRQIAADKITADLNGDLEKVGMRLSNVEITELWSRPKPSGSKGAN